MPDYPESISLATEVATRVLGRHPEVTVSWPGSSDFYHGTIVYFEPTAPKAARADLYVNFDQSFTLISGRFVCWEDEPTTGTHDSRAQQIVARIEDLAENGLKRNWADRLIGGRKEHVARWDGQPPR